MATDRGQKAQPLSSAAHQPGGRRVSNSMLSGISAIRAEPVKAQLAEASRGLIAVGSGSTRVFPLLACYVLLTSRNQILLFDLS
jgi:hypothetical protein